MFNLSTIHTHCCIWHDRGSRFEVLCFGVGNFVLFVLVVLCIHISSFLNRFKATFVSFICPCICCFFLQSSENVNIDNVFEEVDTNCHFFLEREQNIDIYMVNISCSTVVFVNVIVCARLDKSHISPSFKQYCSCKYLIVP